MAFLLQYSISSVIPLYIIVMSHREKNAQVSSIVSDSLRAA